MRKVSDMVLLLGSRGRSRGRGKSSLGQSLGWLSRWVFGTRAKSERPVRGAGGLVLAGIACVCFGAGYFVGGRFGGAKGTPGSQLHAPQPGVLDVNTDPLANQGLVVAFYGGLAPEDAKPRAKALAEKLAALGVKKAKPYERRLTKGVAWCVVVYYDSDAEKAATRARLLELAPTGDDALEGLRSSEFDGETWPFTLVIPPPSR